MYTLSAKALYGVTALVELAENFRSGPIQIRDLAGRGGIPQHYLEQILSVLKRSGIVRSHRGAHGGYELVQHPDDVTLQAVLVELEGPLQVAPGTNGDALRELWEGLERHIETYLSRSLGDVIRDRRAATADADFMI